MNSGINRQLVIYGTGGVLNRAIGFLLIPLYTSYLTLAEYGILALVGVTLQLISFVGLLGVSTASMRFYHEADADSDYQKRIYANASVILLVWPLFLFLGLYGIVRFHQSPEILGVRSYPLVLFVLVIGALGPLTKLLLGLLRVERKATAYVVANLAFFIVQSFLIIYLVAVKRGGIEGQLLGQLIGNAIFFVGAAVYLFHNCHFKFDRALIWNLLKFGIPLVPFFVFAWMNVAAGRFILQEHLSLESLGIFFLAAQFGGVLSLISSASDNAFAPHFYHAAQSMDGKEVLGRLITKYVVLFSLCALFLVAVAPHIVVLVASDSYHASIPYIAPLLLANLIYAFASPVAWSLTFSKRTSLLSFVRVIATGFLLVQLAGLVLTGRVSMASVIGAMILANALMLCYGAFVAQKHFKLSVDFGKLGAVLLLVVTFGTVITILTIELHWIASITASAVIFLLAAAICFRVADIRWSTVGAM